jgi:transposase
MVLNQRRDVENGVRALLREVEKLTRRVIDEVRVEPTCRRLMTVPGVGPLTALAFRATVDRPNRFRRSRASWR